MAFLSSAAAPVHDEMTHRTSGMDALLRRDRPFPTSEPDQLSVLSWNVLADCYVTTGHGMDTYRHAGAAPELIST